MAQAMSSLIGTSWSWAGAPSPDCKDCTFLISEHPSRDAVHSVSIALPSPLNFPGLLADQVKKGLWLSLCFIPRQGFLPACL